MKKSIIDLMLCEQRESGLLSTSLECEAFRVWLEVVDKIESIVADDKYLLYRLEESVMGMLNFYEANAYKAGVRDGIRTMKEIEAFN